MRGVGEVFETDVPARLDRLPWSHFHWLVVAALGITWILDGLEVTLVGALAPALKGPLGLGLSDAQIGLTASAYVFGVVVGAVVFGRLTDIFGRRRMFMITVGIYAAATVASGFSWDFWSFMLFRFATGMGIGGEYGAINSAIDELVPARRRGFTAVAVNGTWWVGTALGAVGSTFLLDPAVISQDWGWRLAFFTGGLLAVVILFIRRYVPESPRWLMTHGRHEEAQAIVAAIERRVERRTALPPMFAPHPKIRLVGRTRTSWSEVAITLFKTHPKRTVLGVILMATQAFCYNAIFFTYAQMLTRFYDVPPKNVGWFILPFALGNVLGPLVLGRLFDSWGRRPMIGGSYAISGVLLCLTGWMFAQGMLTAETQTIAWSVIFFFASAAASAAYLTVGELFPLETRAMTISLFVAFGTLLGGVGAPALFGALIGQGERGEVFLGYLLGGGLMLVGALAAWFLGVKAERKPLEMVAAPLSLASEERR
ncbi:MFS transporter [Phenylobacterium sp.]|jgi:MFS family permease|uniref:MFS transporter n=1 Tax=Phenylobacterium sp. TaxID=1871053 RepID=UPI002F94AC73